MMIKDLAGLYEIAVSRNNIEAATAIRETLIALLNSGL
jgi:hypothetical protein